MEIIGYTADAGENKDDRTRLQAQARRLARSSRKGNVQATKCQRKNDTTILCSTNKIQSEHIRFRSEMMGTTVRVKKLLQHGSPKTAKLGRLYNHAQSMLILKCYSFPDSEAIHLKRKNLPFIVISHYNWQNAI